MPLKQICGTVHGAAHCDKPAQPLHLTLTLPAQTQAAARPVGGLHEALLRIATPQKGRPKEVMIAISNFNLWPIGALPHWIKVAFLP